MEPPASEAVLAATAERTEQVGLKLHPDKTRVVYCKDAKRRGRHGHTSFTFSGCADLLAPAASPNGIGHLSTRG